MMTEQEKVAERAHYLKREAREVIDRLFDLCSGEPGWFEDGRSVFTQEDDEPIRKLYRERVIALQKREKAGDEDAGELIGQEVYQEAARRFLAHVCQLYFEPEKWDAVPVTKSQQMELIVERGPEVTSVFEDAWNRVTKEREEAFGKALKQLIKDGFIDTQVTEGGEVMVRLKKTS